MCVEVTVVGEELRREQAGSSALVVRGWGWIQVLPAGGTAQMWAPLCCGGPRE